jgi:predicted transcriptional regulator
METGRYATIDELARAEKINKSYVSRVLRRLLPSPGNAIVGLVKRSRNHATNSPCITG